MPISLCDIFDLDGARQTVLTDEIAPALMDWVRKQSRAFGLKKVPEVWLLHHALPMGLGGIDETRGRNVPCVAITEGALDRVFGKPNLAKEVPDGLKYLIGHEMSHAREGLTNLKLKRLPLFAVPVLSLVGYEMYTEARKRNQEDPSKDIHQQLDEVTEEEKEKRRQGKKEHYDFFDASMLDWAKRIAVLGGGLVAGGAVCRHLARASEFAADRAGVIASGNPQACIDTLHKFGVEIEKDTGPKLEQWMQDFPYKSFREKCSELFYITKLMVKEAAHSAHPNEMERELAICKFAGQRGLPAPTHGI